MNLVALSINHRAAPVEVREKLWFSANEIRQVLRQLKDQYFEEVMVFSTCNRTELYGFGGKEEHAAEASREFLIQLKDASGHVNPGHFVAVASEGVVSHLFKVASGIDSMVIGDIQILNQVKEGFSLAREEGVLGPVLNRLLQTALRVGKRTRSETRICEGAVSVSYAAVELAGKIFEDLQSKSVLLIGAGKTGELTVKHLASKGIGKIKIANRTRSKAEALVALLGGEVIEYEALVDALQSVDIVITSVASPSYIVQPHDVQKVMKERQNNPLFLIDIGVPRNVNPAARKIDNVFLYDIDSLGSVVELNLSKRGEEIPHVMRIIEEERDDFLHWVSSLQVGPTIQELRESVESIRLQEVQKHINRFTPEDRDLVELLTRRIVNKILHHPITTLRQGAENGDGKSATVTRIAALREMFGIGKDRNRNEE
jgi:glutamyl-tRNA reductase